MTLPLFSAAIVLTLCTSPQPIDSSKLARSRCWSLDDLVRPTVTLCPLHPSVTASPANCQLRHLSTAPNCHLTLRHLSTANCVTCQLRHLSTCQLRPTALSTAPNCHLPLRHLSTVTASPANCVTVTCQLRHLPTASLANCVSCVTCQLRHLPTATASHLPPANCVTLANCQLRHLPTVTAPNCHLPTASLANCGTQLRHTCQLRPTATCQLRPTATCQLRHLPTVTPSLANCGTQLRHLPTANLFPPLFPHSGEVSAHEGRELAKSFDCPFLETSARTRINVEESFFELVREIKRGKAEVGGKQEGGGKKKKLKCQVL
jgi:hypothetical protein